jgi:hypothetical protein
MTSFVFAACSEIKATARSRMSRSDGSMVGRYAQVPSPLHLRQQTEHDHPRSLVLLHVDHIPLRALASTNRSEIHTGLGLSL